MKSKTKITKPRLLVSACLLGQPVRYDGRHNQAKIEQIQTLYRALEIWTKTDRVVAICPESLGGLPTPRPAAEITTSQGDGHAVLDGKSHVITSDQQVTTRAFIKGAQQTLKVAQSNNIKLALLAARSPSCGTRQIYSGDHNNHLVPGDGVTVALLKQHGIQCFNPDQAGELLQAMDEDQPINL